VHSRGTAIVIDGGANNRVEGCTMAAAGGFGLHMAGVKNSAIRNVIHDVGLGGIGLTGGDRKTLRSANNYAEGNEIYRFGQILRTYQPGILLEGVGNRIAGNLIHDGPHAGIILKGNEHAIEGNELRNLCLEAADCGAIYSGRDWTFRGNQIRLNRIHHIPGYGLSKANERSSTVQYSSPNLAVGIYLDDAVSGFTVYGNVIYRIGRYGIQIGGGRDNVVVNNVIVDAFPALVVDARWETYPWTMNSEGLQHVPYDKPPWSVRYPRLAAPMRNSKWPEGNEIRHNLFVRSEKERCEIPVVAYSIPESATAIDQNLLWSPGCGVGIAAKLLERGVQGTLSFADWKGKGFDTRSVIADPLSLTLPTPTSTWQASPAFALGFRRLARQALSLPQSRETDKRSPPPIRRCDQRWTTLTFTKFKVTPRQSNRPLP
jgi:hypothetical protein